MSNQNPNEPIGHKAREGIFTAISFGAFLILIGSIFLTTPDLWSKLTNFFNNLTFGQFARTGIYLPAPEFPAAHAVLYGAILELCVGLSILQVILLILRLLLNSPIRKNAETAGSLVFWLGASYLVFTYLNSSATLSGWFVFWAGVLIVLGLSWLFRALILFASRR